MEKERYIIQVNNDLQTIGVFDLQENKYVVNERFMLLNTAHLLCDLFSKVDLQDSRIKELEKLRDKGNQKLENFYNEKIDELDDDYNKHLNELIEEKQKLEKENQKLKQSQNQKAIEVLEKIRKYFYKGDCSLIDGCELEEFIANQLKELRGEEE